MEGVAKDNPSPGGKVIFSGVMKDDDFETPSSQKTEKTLPSVSSEGDDGGIDIPDFLQPLLGLDFMPFVKPSKSGESTTSAPAILQPKTKAIQFQDEEANVATNEQLQSGGDDLREQEKESSETIESAKKKKRKKTILRLLRKSLGSKSKSSSKPLEEDLNLSMSTCESFSLQSLNVSFDSEDNNSVLTGELLETSTLDTSLDVETSVDCSNSATSSKKSKGRRFFKRKGKQSKAASAKMAASANSSAQDTLKWLQTQQSSLQNHQSAMQQVQSEMLTLQQKSNGIQKRILSVTDEITALQSALQIAEMNLRNELNDFEAAKMEMATLEKSAEKAAKAVLESFKTIQNGSPAQVKAIEPPTPSRPMDAASAPTPKIANFESASSFQEIEDDVACNAFIRVHDFNLENGDASESPGFLFVDENVKPIVENLAKLGLNNIRDESDRFKPTRDTKKTLSKYEEKGIATNTVEGKDVLVWMGDCGHKNHGCRWPVVKSRGLINTSPKELAEFMLDSSRIKEYNEMSQGRDDVVIFQDGLQTTAEESKYGIPGVVKVLRSRNKPKLLPKAVQITSLLYAKPLDNGAYMLVNRSIFEDDKGTLKNDKEIITSEMLLGVNLIRPAGEDGTMSEFNSITHIFPPGVPEFLAKKVAPSSASNMIKDIQKLFD